MAQVTLEMSEYQRLVNAKTEADERVAALQKELDAFRSLDGATIDLMLKAGLLAAKSVVEFAVANLHPESVRDWPRVDLVAFANAVETFATDQRDRDRAQIWRTFAYECEGWERKRMLRDQLDPQEVLNDLRQLDDTRGNL
jgi:hypothetical protein